MQVLKKYVFLFAAFILAGCSSSNRTAPAITGYDTAVMYENLNSYDSINLINRDVINDGNFRVGMLLPLSGEASKYGQGLKNAALMALDDVQNDNLILQFYDTQSTASGARVAVENAIAQNASLIIGPLMSTSVNAIKDETTYKDIPVIAFSTNESVLEPQVYTLGLLVDEQVNRIISYAASQKRSRFALLLPDNQTGIAIAPVASVVVAVDIQNGHGREIGQILQILLWQVPAGKDQVDPLQMFPGAVVPQGFGGHIRNRKYFHVWFAPFFVPVVRSLLQLLQVRQAVDGHQRPGLDVQIVVMRQCTVHALVQPVHLHELLGRIDQLFRCMQHMACGVQLAMEDAQFILAQQLFHQVQQLQSACRQVGAVVDLFGTAAHAPPVIHRPGTAAVVVPGAVKNGADDLNIEGCLSPG